MNAATIGSITINVVLIVAIAILAYFYIKKGGDCDGGDGGGSGGSGKIGSGMIEVDGFFMSKLPSIHEHFVKVDTAEECKAKFEEARTQQVKDADGNRMFTPTYYQYNPALQGKPEVCQLKKYDTGVFYKGDGAVIGFHTDTMF